MEIVLGQIQWREELLDIFETVYHCPCLHSLRLSSNICLNSLPTLLTFLFQNVSLAPRPACLSHTLLFPRTASSPFIFSLSHSYPPWSLTHLWLQLPPSSAFPVLTFFPYQDPQFQRSAQCLPPSECSTGNSNFNTAQTSLTAPF